MSTNADLLGLSQDTRPVISISASQSLNELAIGHEPVSTGVARLDQVLSASDQGPGGILRGQVTEVFGPPGVGKTSLALQSVKELDNLIYFRTPTLPHLLALLLQPPANFPPSSTSLIVVDTVSSLFPAYFPNAADLKDRLAQGKITDKAQLQWLLNRKWNVSSELATHLTSLASRNIAVLAINQTHTKIKGQPRATLHPVLAGGGWENCVQTRIVLYRDLPDARFAEITKRAGRILPVRMAELIVQFRIEADGIREPERSPEHDSPHQSSPALPQPLPDVLEPTPTRKRKAEAEIADSQDEESDEGYEWMNDTLENEA
ncbi:hypothetical protein N7495_009009 [Penicillium taxi]|uniref:uncharacterized protein n=1 Tax=Penicillium taxi TaxID=168475 RepID=UPI0025459133|nr:uncharacterized protein N7495_009009 [Penicillium taxi]KAJ5888968.1 hypothetical protein N7495_009009 [Penicillium taxi]